MCLRCHRNVANTTASEIEQQEMLAALRRDLVGEKRRKARMAKKYWDHELAMEQGTVP